MEHQADMEHQAGSLSEPTVAVHAAGPEMTWLQAARGQLVRLHLTDGKVLVGQLLSVDRAALVVQGSGAVPLLVYKHSVTYIAVEEPEDRR